jgi:hypothetical protein
MTLRAKVLEHLTIETSAQFARLHREHVEQLRIIASDPQRHGSHLRSRTHGRSILNEICRTYWQRAEAIHAALLQALRFQEDEPIAVEDLTSAFLQFFEPERERVLEHSRPRLVQIDGGSFINETVMEANRLAAWFRTKAEHVAADRRPERTITGETHSLASEAGEKPRQ